MVLREGERSGSTETGSEAGSLSTLATTWGLSSMSQEIGGYRVINSMGRQTNSSMEKALRRALAHMTESLVTDFRRRSHL